MMRNEAMIRKDMEKHVATYTVIEHETLGKIEHLRWGRKGSSGYCLYYMTIGGSLIVRGDLGDAIYRVYDKQSFKFWANCGVSYFKEKCDASEGGRGYKWNEWDETECVEQIDTYVNDSIEELRENPEFNEAEFYQLVMEAKAAACTEEDFIQWLTSDGERMMGHDYWDHSPYDWGHVVPFRLECHLLGIKLAMEDVAKQPQPMVIGPWEHHDVYCREDWQSDVAAGDTNLGYSDWVNSKIESHKDDEDE